MTDWRTTADPSAFEAAVGGLLRADPVRHTTQLTILDAFRRTGPHAYGLDDPLFGWLGEPEPVAAFLCTPGFPVLLTSVADDDARALADTLPISPAGVNAEPSAAVEFAEAWRKRTGAASWPLMRQRLYRLGDLAPPPPPPGSARTATPADASRVLTWNALFADEARGGVPPQTMIDRLRSGCVLLWEVDGEAVSMAARTPAVDGMTRVAPVYTPPEHRRRGYGAAVTAALSRAALDEGVRDVVLFTDLANPTTNAIYQAIGYRPVGDRLILGFTEAAT
ncbi:GNAT family N-acetyltransferase [Actinomadura gamaensis]|uniref:GNAT family N-acetyltransferase n=1 Tax=Actinomadura gamaensis TaxID=1763541 RepID=A0ABV9TV27_9ACTN